MFLSMMFCYLLYVVNFFFQVFDGFIPELVEMLSSQMNPAVVCTTAGLCNSDWSDRLQTEYHAAQLAETVSKDNCHGCNNLISSLVEKIQHKGKEDVLTILFDVSIFSSCLKLNVD